MFYLLILLGCGDPSGKASAKVLSEELSEEETSFSIETQQRDVEKAKEDLSCVKQYLIAQQEVPNLDFTEYEKKECVNEAVE